MEYFLHRLHTGMQQVIKSLEIFDRLQSTKQNVVRSLERISKIGYTPDLDDYEKRKLAIFNQLNFFQLITGIIFPIGAMLTSKNFTFGTGYIAVLPAFISLLVLLLNFLQKYQAALLCYFILYPVFTCVIYINGFNLGIELSFVLYGILSVFFLQDIGYMLFTVTLSMTSYFILSIAWKDYRYQLESYNHWGYLINHILSIIYIFYGLYLIKRENSSYQFGMATKNRELHRKNLEIEEQKKEIVHKAQLVEKQAAELDALNQVKDKMFSIISHDLKSPMYALRNVFTNAKNLDLPAEEIKEMIPEVVNDLNYTTALIENLLQWAKSQMQSSVIVPQRIDVNELANEAIRSLHLQAEEKKIAVKIKAERPVFAWADKDMIRIVIRNLLSNAIKFTPKKGRIEVGVSGTSFGAKLYVRDSGTGIHPETIKKINENEFYTTNGTHNEKGTGLGLALCKEFLEKNKARLMIETAPGSGSTFSFTLPCAK